MFGTSQSVELVMPELAHLQEGMAVVEEWAGNEASLIRVCDLFEYGCMICGFGRVGRGEGGGLLWLEVEDKE